jgi:glycerol-3-phosphate dehydrogenase
MSARDDGLDRLRAKETWDVLVIGGGATGLGTAVDSASRGYRTLLLESHDFAQGTSSRSTKLVHGGVRYLERGEVGLVREALRERGRLLRNAPHLVHARSFLVPAYRAGSRLFYGTGLWLYDRLAGRLGLGRSRAVGRDEALALIATLEPERLRGGIVYHDGQFDDARLAVALARTIADHGGLALNGVGVIGLSRNDAGRIDGVRAVDRETGEDFHVRARVVVNATGVWVDQVRRMDDPGTPPMLVPSQGAHVVLDRSFLPGETSLMVPKTDDGRVLFAIPWHGRVLVGTTDTPVSTVSNEPRALPDEVDFLLRHAARYLTRDPSLADVLSVFAGLRPLIAPPGKEHMATARLSREHATVVSPSGLVTITGGKWTTYRQMGQSVVDLAASVAALPRRSCVTADLRLHGWTDPPAEGPLAKYGADAAEVARVVAERSEWREPLHQRLPDLTGEVAWTARFESARTVEDVLARRSRALFLDARAAMEAAPRVAAILADELTRDDAWRDAQVRAFRTLAAGYVLE